MSNANMPKRIGQASRFCGKCHRELPCTVEYFRLRNGDLAHTCRECAERYLKSENEGTPRKGAGCHQCEGLPWRRPEDGSPCKCREVYAEEPPVTLSYGARWTENKTVFPSSGGWE